MLLVSKQVSVALLLLAILLQSISKAVIFADFYTNQDYIARNLCENRDKPIIHCYGRCQLNKRLVEDEKQEGNNPERRENAWNVILFADSGRSLSLPALAMRPFSHLPAISDCRII